MNSTRPGQARQRGSPFLGSWLAHDHIRTRSSEEFTRHGISDIVTLTHRNVCKNGFTVTDTADSGTTLFPVLSSGAQTHRF